MAEPVDANEIEGIVGVPRHPVSHYARAVSSEQVVYILHSQACVDTRPDLLKCPYTVALDRGIDPDGWPEDEPVRVMVSGSNLCHWH